MEALLEKEGDVESWNDERMDELSRRVDAGFEKAATKVELTALKDEINLRFAGVDRRFDEVDARFNRFEKIIETQFGRINDRLDKLTFAIIGILGTFAAASFATILGSALS
jgi:hypothetical protein